MAAPGLIRDDDDTAATQQALAGFHPAVAGWFTESFSSATAPQRAAWPAIRRGESTLVFSPTGSGKTLSAFLGCIDRLVSTPPKSTKGRGCRVIYISPLKALASDVERNLQAPLVGIARVAALRNEIVHLPTVAVRTGDTPPRERAKFAREPSDILITTPESLFLLLTSKARASLVDVETVIVDEIHALVPTKRGAHLAVSLARLDALREDRSKPLQRIGLSATQRPLDEVARYLGGYVDDTNGSVVPAPVTIIDARGKKKLEVTVEHTLIDDDRPAPIREEPMYFAAPPTMSPVFPAVPLTQQTTTTTTDAPGTALPLPPHQGGPASRGVNQRGTWATIPPKIVALTHTARTTLVFVNSRRLAERLTAAINDEAGAEIAAAHHGSLARGQRQAIEESLKLGAIKVLVSTSSLELGVDIGSIDVVVQVEAPPSVAAALQRIGRAGHQVGAVSRGVIYPRYTTDLLACAATTGAMFAGVVEATAYPRNPLDILAQQIVAMVAVERVTIDNLFNTVRTAAPFAELPRVLFDSVVDMLAGKTAIDLGLEDHEGLRARLRFDRETGFVTATTGAHRVVVQNAGTIVDRGLYGVFLATGSESAPSVRVGELDEEMVFETRPGEVFRLGASSWRVEEITHDRVLVTPAPGEPGKLPFWRGESPLRPLELGERMGALTRTLLSTPKAAGVDLLVREHGLVEGAGDKLVSSLLAQQDKGGGVVPDDRTLVVERGRDELGDWRVCLLSPWGAQVLQPLAMCISERADAELGVGLEVATANDGVVFRFPESDEPPDILALMPEADDVERLVLQGLAGSPMFAARFRESAARALLLPRRRPGMRAPLWKQRQRAQSLLTSVKDTGEFPIVLEACRECLRDIFDVPGLVTIVEELKTGLRKVVVVDNDTPSPFAAALLSGFVRGAIYDGDVPLAERRAQALAVDHDQLKTLLGEGALRELLDDDVIAAVDGVLQATAPGMGAKHADGLHAVLVRLGDLSIEEIKARVLDPSTTTALVDAVIADRRAVFVKVGGDVRVIAIEDVGRYRDALGTQPPPGVPEAFLSTTTNPLAALIRRFVKSHALSTAQQIATRFALPLATVTTTLQGLVRGGVIVEGAFSPGGDDVDYADPEVLRSLRRRTLARLRAEIEPVEQRTFVRARLRWQGLLRPRRGLDGLLDAIAALQGTPLLWSSVESQVLPARVADYRPDMLDALALAGEIMWVGVEAVGEHDARVMLFLTDALPWLWRPPTTTENDATPHPLREPILAALRARGASFFSELALRLQIAAPKTTTTTTTTVPATTTEPPSAGPPSFSTWLRDKRSAGPTVSPTSAVATANVEAELWALAMRGVVTNDSFRPLRARLEAAKATKRRGREQRAQQPFRSRRSSAQAPAADGRWSIVMPEAALDDVGSLTRRAAAVAEQLVRRDGVLAPEAVKEAVGEGALPLPLSAVRDALRALEDGGRIRRGYFVSDLGGMQYAAPEAVEALRALPPIVDDDAEVTVLAASDPANPFGGIVAWPTTSSTTTLHRGAGARVVIVDGALAAWLPKHLQRVTTFLPVDEPERGRVAAALAKALAAIASTRRFVAGKGLLLAEIDGLLDAARDAHPLVPHLLRAGFVKSAGGLLFPRVSPTTSSLTATRPSAPPSAWLGQASTAPTTDAASEVGISDDEDVDDDDDDDDVDDDD